jgi:hypothetical protein
MTDETLARQRVAAGVAVLDQADPNWRRLLNPDLLDMASGRFLPHHPDHDTVVWPASCGCVAAQWCYVQMGQPDAAGNFQDGVMLLADLPVPGTPRTDRGIQQWAVDHGLLAERQLNGFDWSDPDLEAEYELLTRLWREEIRRGDQTRKAPWLAPTVLAGRDPDRRWVLIHDDGGLCGCDDSVRGQALAGHRDDHFAVEVEAWEVANGR